MGIDAAALLQRLDTAVLVRRDEGVFEHISPPPAWLPGACGDQIELGGRFAFLDHFLVEAEQFWSSATDGELSSGPWVEALAFPGEEKPFEATALFHDGHPMLLLRALGEAHTQRVAALQVARDKLLAEEWLKEEIRKGTVAIREREEEIVMRLLMACGLRDDETGAHIRRIGLYSELVARALGWDADRADMIRLAAPMHDIGKIGVPDRILRKPGPLTEEERRVMEDHTLVGARLLENNDFPLLAMAHEIALCHHERHDGLGYPRGLAGGDIPQSAAIVAVADVYDALVHGRVYKDAQSEEEAIAYLRRERGAHFDPVVLDAFLSVREDIRAVRVAVPEGGACPAPTPA